MALQKIWIDNVSGNDGTGDGSSGNPYASTQGALDHGALTTDGRAIYYLRTATAYSGANNSALSFATSGNPSSTNPLFFVAVENTSEDDPTSLVEVDLGSAVFISGGSIDNCGFANLSFHGDGSALMFDMDNNCCFVNCEFYIDATDASSNMLVRADVGNHFIGCYFHDVNQAAFSGISANCFYRCLFVEETGANGSHATGSGIGLIDNSSGPNFVIQCAFHHTSTTSVAIDSSPGIVCIDCSFFDDTAGNTQNAIESQANSVVLNCIFDGWNGTGGTPISGATPLPLIRRLWTKDSNALEVEGSAVQKENTSLTLAPFADGPNDDFTPQSNVDGMDEVTYPSAIGGDAAP